MISKIPRTFVETENLSNSLIESLCEQPHIYYEPSDGEIIEVTHWFRYPTYDFILGKPIPESPRYVKEVACSVVRYKNGKSYATYLDLKELRDLTMGLLTIYNDEKKRSKK